MGSVTREESWMVKYVTTIFREYHPRLTSICKFMPNRNVSHVSRSGHFHVAYVTR